MLTQTASAMNIFDALCSRLHVTPDRHGEAHVPCPECGKKPQRGQTHFSFSVRGGYCFVCGWRARLGDLVEKFSPDTYTPVDLPAARKPQRPATWRAHASELLHRYTHHPDRLERWRGYKPVPESVILAKQLGVGVLPASRCPHERLVVPILDGTMLVGLRGRALDCACAKWLPASGTPLEHLPLYNADALYSGCIVWLVENPVDALLITAFTQFVGVAIYAVTYWRDEWLQIIQATQPEFVIVALDNDLPGNGGDKRRAEFLADWRREHPQAEPPPAQGVRIVNRLCQAHLPARLYPWGRAAHKADVGQLILSQTLN